MRAMRYLRKINENRAAPGWERTIWRLLPGALAISVLAPASVALATRMLVDAGPDGTKAIATVDITAIAVAITAVTAVFTVAIGCVVVYVMKGPGYVADGCDLTARSRGDARSTRDAQAPPARLNRSRPAPTRDRGPDYVGKLYTFDITRPALFH